MKKRVVLIALLLLMIVQCIVPMYMIYKQERIMTSGQEFLFRCRPIDPLHPLMGRYVALNLTDLEGIPFAKGEKFQKGKPAYVSFETDKDGFVKMKEFSYLKPNNNYFSVKEYVLSEVTPLKIHVRVPFDKYYMDESLAPMAESVLWELTQKDTVKVYAKIKIRDGKGVVDSVYINKTRLEDFVKEKIKLQK